jgi:hypothetical protein
MKRAPRSRQRHDLYAKYHDYDSEISDLLGECGLTYDANGNMLTGLGGRIMTYDGENRPLSVTHLGKRTCYLYGADGARLKKVEGLPPTQDCTALPANANTTVYFGAVEIRNWKVAGQEQVLTYPHPAIKLLNGVTPAAATYLHRDGLSSVRAITDTAGVKIEAALYKPFGPSSRNGSCRGTPHRRPKAGSESGSTPTRGCNT